MTTKITQEQLDKLTLFNVHMRQIQALLDDQARLGDDPCLEGFSLPDLHDECDQNLADIVQESTEGHQDKIKDLEERLKNARLDMDGMVLRCRHLEGRISDLVHANADLRGRLDTYYKDGEAATTRADKFLLTLNISCLTDEELSLLNTNRPIEVIKRLRERVGCSIKGGKEFLVENAKKGFWTPQPGSFAAGWLK